MLEIFERRKAKKRFTYYLDETTESQIREMAKLTELSMGEIISIGASVMYYANLDNGKNYARWQETLKVAKRRWKKEYGNV